MLLKRLNFIILFYIIGISFKVKEMESNGVKVINFSIGEFDFNVFNNVKFYGIDFLNKDYIKYDLVLGLKIFREEICKKFIEENNCNYLIDEIVVLSGVKNLIINILLVLIDEGDEVLLLKFYWVSYFEMIKLVNVVLVFIDIKKENGFKLIKEEFEKFIIDKIKIFVINNFLNFIGSVYIKDELIEIVDVCI